MSDPQNPGGPGLALILGIMMILGGGRSIITGKGGSVWSGIPVVDWIGWIMLPFGIAISIMSIRSLWRGGGKPKKYTDEDLARAKEKLDRMYFEEHGSWPKTDRKKDS